MYLNSVKKNIRHFSEIVKNRDKFLSPVINTFTAFEKPLILEKGKMSKVWDNEGNEYIDLVGQNICISVGHCHPWVVNSAINQMKKLSHCSSMYHHENPGRLAKKLVNTLPPHPSGEDWVVHFVNNGSEAVDLAVQMSKEYTGNNEIFSLYKSYHGLQGYAAGLTSIGKSNKKSHASMYPSIKHVEPNNIDQMQNEIKYNTSGNIAGMIIEPLQGYGGVFELEKGYMKNAFELVRKNNGVCISDEVQTGFGRCGDSFWGFQMKNNDIIPDIITAAKGMGNGVGIIGCVISKKSIAEAFSNKFFFNTYGSNPVAVAASESVLDVIKKQNIVENCKNMGTIFKREISYLCNKYPSVYKEIRGTGLFLALEIYGKTLEDSIKNCIEIHKKTLKYGILISRGSAIGNVFRIQPPMCITENEVMKVITILEHLAIEQINENSSK